MFSGSAPSLSKTVPTTLKGFGIKRNWNIARNIMCFIINVIIAKQKFLANLIYLSFSKFRYRQNMF